MTDPKEARERQEDFGEPLHVVTFQSGTIIVENRERTVVVHIYEKIGERYQERRRELADRIVACVNACTTLKAENAELREALEMAEPLIGSCGCSISDPAENRELDHAIMAACAAVEKALAPKQEGKTGGVE